MNRRRTFFGVAALLALGICHFAYFAILGPPASWGTDVKHVTPRFGAAHPTAMDSIRRVAADTAPRLAGDALRRPYDVPGKPQYFDALPATNEAILQTSGRFWSEQQRLFWRARDQQRWREIDLPSDFIVSNPRLVRVGDRTLALMTRWHPWWPHTRNYGRFLKSLVDRESQAEHAIYSLDPSNGSLRYLFPGDALLLSPNRERAAYLNSDSFGLFSTGGMHTIRVWELRDNRRDAIASLSESDPGSGRSFDYAWSRDSGNLLIYGTTSGFGNASVVARGAFRVLYSLRERVIYDLGAPIP